VPDPTPENLDKLARLVVELEVGPGIYQVRGYDLSNMTLVEGCTGVIVIDPLYRWSARRRRFTFIAPIAGNGR